MTRNLSSTIALSALLALLAAPAGVLAQDAAPPAAAATAQPDIPQVLRDAGLTGLTAQPGKRGGLKIEGKQPDGSDIRAVVDDKGALRGVFVKGDAPLAQALVDQLVPQSVRDQAVYGQFAKLRGVMTGEHGVMLAGTDREGEKMRAGFAQDGTLMRFGRGDDARGPRGHDHDMRDRDRGGHGHGKRGQGEWGQGGHGHDGWKRGEGHGPSSNRHEAAAPLNEDAVRQALQAAGYTQPGALTQRGPRTVVEALNPQGEPVLVQLDAQGNVLRETIR